MTRSKVEYSQVYSHPCGITPRGAIDQQTEESLVYLRRHSLQHVGQHVRQGPHPAPDGPDILTICTSSPSRASAWSLSSRTTDSACATSSARGSTLPHRTTSGALTRSRHHSTAAVDRGPLTPSRPGHHRSRQHTLAVPGGPVLRHRRSDRRPTRSHAHDENTRFRRSTRSRSRGHRPEITAYLNAYRRPGERIAA
jgi:hypothetical protein